jgi:hypothetical protein
MMPCATIVLGAALLLNGAWYCLALLGGVWLFWWCLVVHGGAVCVVCAVWCCLARFSGDWRRLVVLGGAV